MAFASVSYTANGSANSFAIPFPYISRLHVEVYVNDVRVTSGFTITGGTLTFATPPAANATVRIRRNTSQQTRLVEYRTGALLPSTLNRDSLQAFYMAQEALDAAGESGSSAVNPVTESSIATALADNLANPEVLYGRQGSNGGQVAVADVARVGQASLLRYRWVVRTAAISGAKSLQQQVKKSTEPDSAYVDVPGSVIAFSDLGLGSTDSNSTAGPLSLSPVSIQNVSPTSARFSVLISGTLPAGALQLIQFTPNIATGPWQGSPEPTVAQVGQFTFDASGLTPGTTYFVRASIYSEPGSGQPSIVHAVTELQTFATPALPSSGNDVQALFNALTVEGRGYINNPATVPVGTQPTWPVIKNRLGVGWNNRAGATPVVWSPGNPIHQKEFFKYIYGQSVGRDRGWIRPWFVLAEELDWTQAAFSQSVNVNGAVVTPANNQVFAVMDRYRMAALFRRNGVLTWEAPWGTNNLNILPARYSHDFMNASAWPASDTFTSSLRPGATGYRVYNGPSGTNPSNTFFNHGTAAPDSRALLVSEMGFDNDDNGLLAIVARCDAWVEAIPGQPASAVNNARLVLNLGGDTYPQVTPGGTSPGSKELDITSANGFPAQDTDDAVQFEGCLLGDWHRLSGTPRTCTAVAYPRSKGNGWLAQVPPLPSWFTA